MSRWRVGVDSGGTFTDVCLFDEDSGTVRTWKVSSTPADPAGAILQGVQEGLTEVNKANGSSTPEILYFAHGTTVATNALIQKTGAHTALLTTDGFRDLLEIGRQRRPSLYDFQADKPPVLVGRELRLEIVERTRYDGSIERSLDLSQVREVVRRLKELSPEAVAICFLYSFINPEHERAVMQIVKEELPSAFVTASHEVASEFREFERLSTVVLNAYLGPMMNVYLARLLGGLKEIGISVPPHVTQSNGGIISFETAQQNPVRTILSGPSTGVIAAQRLCDRVGLNDLITFDMGGTSTDVALIEKGVPKLANEMHVHGYPIKAPMLDIHTVGAGGGSIAYIDVGGLLKVGPRSAGADPGPACYERGNNEPTVTDANVVLGTLNPEHLLNGRIKISRKAAYAAVEGLAKRIGIGVIETAQGIVDVVTANMAKAIRLISVQRGHDLRDFTLVSFGGAGPLHSGLLARELDMQRVLVPPSPGILCAMGLLLTELRTNYSMTRLLALSDPIVPEIRSVIDQLERQAGAWFDVEGTAKGDRRLKRSVDMRYAGQNYELSVDVPDGVVGAEIVPELKHRFEVAHEQLYGYLANGDAIQLVTFRLEASARNKPIEFKANDTAGNDPRAARVGERDIYFREIGKPVPCPIYDRDLLKTGNRIKGPAIIEQMDATTVLIPGQAASVDPMLNLIVEVQ